MEHRINLSTSFNMSLGFVPVLVSILCCEFIDQDLAIYMGTITGLVFSYFNYFRSSSRIPNYILYITTAILVIFSLVSIFSANEWPRNWLPLTLEISIIFPLLLIYLYKESFLNYFRKKPDSESKHNYVQAAESVIVSIRVVLIFALIHFAALTITILFMRSLNSFFFWLLIVISPFLVFLLSIIFNQLGINYFNNTMSESVVIPAVNGKGDVTGKVLQEELTEKGNSITVPLIRVAIESQGMLYLSKRSHNNAEENEKIDTPLETFIFFKETIEIGLKRLLRLFFPAQDDLDPRFSTRYHFKNDAVSRLVYLFILHLDDDVVINEGGRFPGGKLWTLQQIDQNIGKGYFSDYFEYEYEHLKTIIGIREKYKGV